MGFNKRIITVLFFSIGIITTLIVAVWMPFNARVSMIDFLISDLNANYHYEVNESLEFVLNDSVAYNDRKMTWHFGNGDTISRNGNVHYTYKSAGKYMVTLELDSKYKVSKYIEVISLNKKVAIDSIPEIFGVSEGYVGEELVFSSYSPGVNAWFWEFGETGTVDAYEGQVVYVYKSPGLYRVKLKTNKTKYPVFHNIRITKLFEVLEEVLVDSLSLAQKDIKNRFQAIADASVSNKAEYDKNLNYILNHYICSKPENVVVVINDDKYNDLYSYCQGLHYLEGNGSNTIVINTVAIDTFKCLSRIDVTQSLIRKNGK